MALERTGFPGSHGMTLKLEGAGYGRVFQLTLELDPGLHVIVGNVSDGTLDLLRLSSGDVAPLRGRVQLDGETPHRSPALRRAFGCAYASSAFDEKLVKDAVARRLELHASHVTPESALSRFGIEALLGRTAASLNPLELHAVELAIALSIDTPKALFLCEPLAYATGSSAHVFLDAIRQRADRSIVICA